MRPRRAGLKRVVIFLPDLARFAPERPDAVIACGRVGLCRI